MRKLMKRRLKLKVMQQRKRKNWNESTVLKVAFAEIVRPVEVNAVKLVLCRWMQIFLVVLEVVFVYLLIRVWLVLLYQNAVVSCSWGLLLFLYEAILIIVLGLVVMLRAFLCFCSMRPFLRSLLISFAWFLWILFSGMSDGCIMFLGWFLTRNFAVILDDFSWRSKEFVMGRFLEMVGLVGFFHQD